MTEPEIVVAEIGEVQHMSGAAPSAPTRAAPLPSRAIAAALAVFTLLCVTSAVALVHRSRTVTRTVVTAGPGSHGSDAIGCPYGHRCETLGQPPDRMARPVIEASGDPAPAGDTTADERTGRVWLGIVATTIRGAPLVVRAQCVPGGSAPAPGWSTATLASGQMLVSGVVGYAHGCSAVVTMQVSRAAWPAARSIVDALLADPRLSLDV